MRKKRITKSTKLSSLIIFVLAVAAALYQQFAPAPAKTPLPDGALAQVSVIDVGQGTGILIKSVDNDGSSIVLVDAGEKDAGSAVCAALDAADAKQIDLAVITHPHTDHYGGMISVLEEYKIKEVWLPDVPTDMMPTNRTYMSFLTALENNGCEVSIKSEAETKKLHGGATLKLLNAFLDSPTSLNDVSLCLRLDVGDASFLMTGDAETALEDELRESGENINCDIFVAGHHGSNTSNKQYFLNEVSPFASVVSVGKDNDYNLPNVKAMSRLSAFGNVYRTDMSGTVIFTIDGEKIHITAEGINDLINSRG